MKKKYFNVKLKKYIILQLQFYPVDGLHLKYNYNYYFYFKNIRIQLKGSIRLYHCFSNGVDRFSVRHRLSNGYIK